MVQQTAPGPPRSGPRMVRVKTVGVAAIGAVFVLAFAGWVGLHRHDSAALWPERQRQLALATQLAEALPRALEAYRAEYGTYPRDLDDLIPRHIRQLPTLSPLPTDRWRYCPAKDLSRYDLSLRFPGDFDPVGFHFDCTLAYRLDGKHPREDHGGMLTWRSGRWGFYSE